MQPDNNRLDTNNNVDNTDTELSSHAKREHSILRFWDDQLIFEKTLNKESPKGEFVFYDGPPYATGLPHFGHLLPSTVKDAIPRFKTMQGYRVSRRWGWDCHGLPIENLIEKELGLTDKKAIVDYGIDKFNKAARDSVFRYDVEWKKIIHRVGRFVDMENNYQTMDSSYTESVWWSFAEFFKRGFVYEGFKTMHVCPRCETTLSNLEVGQGYQDVQDISVYVLFALKNEIDTYFLAWTTTPWTLHGNSALAINPELVYVKVKMIAGDNQGKTFILAKSRLGVLKEKADEYEVVAEVPGAELASIEYLPPFDTYTKNAFPFETEESKRQNAWKTYTADFVTADSGTGIVHIAPAFGDDDRLLAQREGLPMVHHVRLNGHARLELGEPFADRPVKPKEAPQSYDIEVIKYLAHAGLLYQKEKITHSYPHCWRCNFPLLNYATSGWFIETTKLQQKLIDENNKVGWVPKEIGKGRFGSWLENIRDWNISRSRFWGAPIPVWRGEHTGKIFVASSIADIKAHIPKRNSYTLMRHGESESNVLNLVSSQDKTIHGLTDVGRAQVIATANQLMSTVSVSPKQKITKIIASPFLRTKQTAELMAEQIGFPKEQIIFDDRLGENKGGIYEGKTWDEFYAHHLTRRERMYTPPEGGESISDVKFRVSEFLYDIDQKLEGENVLIVTHGLPLKLMKSIADGQTTRDMLRTGWHDVSDPNASIHALDWRQLPKNETGEIDIHRPYIDSVTWQDEETGEKMIRVPEVFDVWYDSGAMPFAQNHYPFESLTPGGAIRVNSQDIGTTETALPPLYPADFIAEGLDQTRGWFYSLLAINAGLFGISPYKHVMVNGLILAEDGRKMSKSLRNYPDLWPTIEKYGADSLRFFLASSPAVRGEEVAFSEKLLDEVNKKVFNRIENMYSFLVMHTGTLPSMTDSEIELHIKNLTHPLDMWAVARLNQTIKEVTENFEGYMIDKATRPIADFIDDMSRLYLKRSRDRFKSDDVSIKGNAIFVTRLVLERLARLMAPVTPFMAEYMYSKVRFGDIESVNLDTWPAIICSDIDSASVNPSSDEILIKVMLVVDKVIERGLAMRADAKIKVRQVLRSFSYDQELTDVLHEVNQSDHLKSIHASGHIIDIIKEELNVKEVLAGDTFVLDTVVTEDLREEGAVRELIRAIQQERKNKNLSPQDSINVLIRHDSQTVVDMVTGIITKHLSGIQKTVHAKSIDVSISQASDQYIDTKASESEDTPPATHAPMVQFLDYDISLKVDIC